MPETRFSTLRHSTARKAARKPAASARRRWILATLICWLLAVVLGIAAASLLQRQMPQILSLEDYSPPVLSRIYAADGTLLQQFGEQRRIVVPLSDLPTAFKEAIVAIEDADFYNHPGIDVSAIMRAVWRDLLAGEKAQGASTITQQLARDLFLTKQKTWSRKLQEWLLALQVEKSYTKDEILELYCNQIYFGHGFYGIEAASRFYYGKPASALSLDEAALMAGLVQRPEVYSPLRSPDRARRRRDHVLRRMVAVGDLTPEMAASAMERPVSPHSKPAAGGKIGLYFLEEVRKNLMKSYGERVLYKQGLEIQTTLDKAIQATSEQVLRRHLEQIDRIRGFRPISRNVIKDEGASPEDWQDPAWGAKLEKGQSARGVVLSVETRKARIRIGNREGFLEVKDAAWTGQQDLRRLLSRGDVTLFTILKLPPGQPLALRLNQEPQVEGAVVVLDVATGKILALTGGYDFKHSQFDRAIQARRQVGSAFKPFLFAAALEKGFSPSDLILDEPTVFVDQPGGRIYQPENYERDYWGLITLRTALEHSRNIPAVKLIGEIGFQPVFDVVQRLGIQSVLKPYPSLALGAVEVNLLEMTSAYGAFANGGLLLKPYLISRLSDRDGRQRFRARSQASEALDPSVAYVLTQMLQGVVRHGTAASIADFPRPVAGKTGTTDGHSDAWFIGYTPSLVCGVWVGMDQSESLGHHQSGARAALPIWNEVMRQAIKKRPRSDFELPPGVTKMAVDPDTGLQSTADSSCPKTILESYRKGTAPTRVCGDIPHFRHSLPYFLQTLPIDAQLRIHLTRSQLDDLLDREGASVSFLPLSSSLSVVYGGRALSLGLQIDAPSEPFPASGLDHTPPQLFTPRGPFLHPPARLDEIRYTEVEGEMPIDERRGLDGRTPDLVILRTDR